MRARIAAIDKEQPVTNLRTMQQHLASSIAQTRLTMLLLGIFSMVALLVASVGLYGLISYSVAQRTQEFGIRLALGAEPSDIVLLVMRQGFWPRWPACWWPGWFVSADPRDEKLAV